jgi:glucose 1-dehydrogenase
MTPSPIRLDDRVALVTGGSSGIGAGIARAFGLAGARVAVNYRGDEAGAQAVVDDILQAGGRAVAVGADVSEEAEVEALVARTEAELGPLDVLVANAGLQQDAPFHELTLDRWRKVIDVNLTGQFLCCRAAVRSFLARPRREGRRARGNIVCMSSVHEVIPWAGHVNYAASKGGVMLMMKSLAQEVAEQGIRVNGIAPGAIRTPINREAWETPDAEAALLKLIPYGRVGEVEDVAKAALWLASDESDYVTGASLFVDGGMSLYPGFREGG